MFFVIIQFICIGLILLPFGPIRHPYGLLAGLPGLTLAWAAIHQVRKMGPGRFNIRPTPRADSVLVTSGVYRYIRHPMYSSVLLSMLGPVLMYWHMANTIIYAVLFINLLAKLRYEERLWLQKSPRYRNYCRQTKRLIPFIF
jgi:protein-S-isoprenylcysteine O-methyltransferase Ste14